MFFTLLILSTIIIGLSMLGLAIKMLILKGGKFPVTSIGGNAKLRAQGITCAKTQELVRFKKLKKGVSCEGCGFQL